MSSDCHGLTVTESQSASLEQQVQQRTQQLEVARDEALKAELKDEGSGPFVFQMKDGKSGEMNYWRMPTAAMDDSEEACDWARRAISVALAAAKAKPKLKRKGG